MKMCRRWVIVWLAYHFGALVAIGAEPHLATRNVVLVTADGVRWQDIFRGADPALLNKDDGGVTDVESLKRDFWRESQAARREALMPFLWNVVGRQGQIYGNADKGSAAKVANTMAFSYPGYNELLTGAPDSRIDSNDKFPNPNVTVFEWLNRKPSFQGKVTAVGCWDVFPFIFNVERSKLYVNAGWVPLEPPVLSESQIMLNKLINQAPRMWDDSREDSLTFQVALEHLRRGSPRVFYIGWGDTDEHAHTRGTTNICGAPRRRWQPQASVGRATISPTVPRNDHHDCHNGPWARKLPARLAGSRGRDGGLRGHMDGVDRPRHSCPR